MSQNNISHTFKWKVQRRPVLYYTSIIFTYFGGTTPFLHQRPNYKGHKRACRGRESDFEAVKVLAKAVRVIIEAARVFVDPTRSKKTVNDGKRPPVDTERSQKVKNDRQHF